MKTKTKKILSVLLAVIMIFGTLPLMNVSAASEITEYAISYTTDNDKIKITDFEAYESGKFTIPSKIDGYPVTEIGNGAFSGCSKLTSITIPDSVKSIGDNAFEGCSKLKSITIGSSVKSIGDFPFEDCNKLANIYVDSNNSTYSSLNGVLFNKSKKTIIIYPVCKEDKSYTIPNSVTKISDSAFSGCTGLTSITIPNSVTSIGDYVFFGCTGLKNITIPDSVISIGAGAFESCAGLTSATIGNSVKSIGQCTFMGCNSLKSITIPDSVTNIGSATFSDCSSLKNIKIGNGVTSIESNTFIGTAYYNNSSNWKNGVLYIGKYLIEAKTSISGAYTIKSGTKCIASSAFSYCRSLTSITIPDSVTNIGNFAFGHCSGLTKITIPNRVTSIEKQTFVGCESLTSVTLGNSVKSIGYNAFYDSGLKSITIPDSMKKIEESAFACCSLTSIIIPKNVTNIGKWAFDGCGGLKSITILNKNCKIYDSSYTIDETAKIIGYSGSTAESYAKKYNRTFEVHAHTYKTTATTKATATKNGSGVTACTVCGNVKSKSTISKIKSITLSNDTFTYNGKVKKPTVTVKDSKGNTLKNGTDYTVKYSSGRKNVGKYTVTVTFKGKYSGTKKLTFKIKPRSTSISKLTAGKKQFTATWYKRTEQTSGYQLEYSTSSSMKNASRKTYTTTSKTSRTVTGLKASTKYYVRIRTYKNVKIDGKTYKYYSAWSSVKSIKTK